MKVGLQRARRRASLALAVGTVAMAGGIVSMGMSPAGATDVCAGSSALNIPYGPAGELYDVPGGDHDVKIFDLPEPLVPGEYIVDTWTFDEYVGRSTDTPEHSERWYAEFLDADGHVVGSTGATDDLADDVDNVRVNTVFSVSMTGTAVKVRLILVKDFDEVSDLVHVHCLGFEIQVPETTPLPEETTPTSDYPPATIDTEPTTTTTEPTTTTTEAPPPAEEPPTTLEPATTTTQPTTTLPVVVLSDTRNLPVTGGNELPLAVAGIGMMLAGGGLVARFRVREA